MGAMIGHAMGALYGTIKTHKADYPIRPVVSDPTNILKNM